jgi:hypothetical protein
MNTSAIRVARRFIAGLADQLQGKMRDLLAKPLDAKKGQDVADWLETNFHFLGAKTPRGGKVFKDQLNKLHWFLKFGLKQQVDPDRLRPTIDAAWDDIQKELGQVVKLFSEEGGKVVPREVKVGANTYLNISGFSEDQLTPYIKSLEQVFAELKGWRKKALAGGIKIALAGPSDFRGTSAGKYKSVEDILYVRATPAVLKRTRGTYGSFDYIIVHELGHRYDYKRKPGMDFDKSEWWTSSYSQTEGESFAELFALTNFGISGKGDQAVLDKFEDYMTTGKVPEKEPVELPEHLRKLFK